MLRVALVHDYLNQYGGGERVLESLMEIFPKAPVFTLFYDEAATHGRFQNRIQKTSFLDFSFARNHHRLFIPLMPLAARSINLGSDFDLIISDTAGFAKGIRYNRKTTKHISYIHTPLRYAWEQDNYLNAILPSWKMMAARPVLNYLRSWDQKYGKRPDVLLANSKFIARKIRECYGRPAQVVYPPVDTKRFYYDQKIKKGNHYLAVGRLLHYKKFDLVIEAFKDSGLPLKIIGSGPEENKLRILAGGSKNIEIVSFVKDDNILRRMYNEAKALIFPQVEDFGLVAAEAQACGLPVIAYSDGGAPEIVENGKTGLLFQQQNKESLLGAVKLFEKKRFNRKTIASQAERFSKVQFSEAISSLI